MGTTLQQVDRLITYWINPRNILVELLSRRQRRQRYKQIMEQRRRTLVHRFPSGRQTLNNPKQVRTLPTRIKYSNRGATYSGQPSLVNPGGIKKRSPWQAYYNSQKPMTWGLASSTAVVTSSATYGTIAVQSYASTSASMAQTNYINSSVAS